MKNVKPFFRTLPEMITHMLREAILAGEWSGGAQLKQEELATRFGVSLGSLREALKILESEGLVRFFPNRGVQVTELSAAEAREIFDIRLFLELGALELAIPNLGADDLAAARKALAEADREGAAERQGELNRRFHETLYRAAGRPRLLALIEMMHNNVERYMRLYLSTMQCHAKSQAEHGALLEACANRDAPAAQAILRRHMAEAGAQLAQYLSR